jgi:hypothetical protein
MEYTFMETTEFTQRIVKRKLEEPLRELQKILSRDPEAGDVEPGACGLRKIRIGDPERQQGKRFGARVHYLHLPEIKHIFLMNVYGKDDQSSLTKDQKKAFCAFIHQLKANLRTIRPR